MAARDVKMDIKVTRPASGQEPVERLGTVTWDGPETKMLEAWRPEAWRRYRSAESESFQWS